eukprot:GEMP01005668.1.p1 GENE.GEMP01005668.1~~GEMP01005668.1.p1  ORF type:complete len:570 (+),score=110.97 GEMP01005668.1:81-1790(+)
MSKSLHGVNGVEEQKHMLLAFLKKFPCGDAQFRDRISVGKVIRVRGVTILNEVVLEVLQIFDASKRKKSKEEKKRSRDDSTEPSTSAAELEKENSQPNSCQPAKVPRVSQVPDIGATKTDSREADHQSENECAKSDNEPAGDAPGESQEALHPGLPEAPSSSASISTLKEYFTQLGVEYRHRAFERTDLLQLLTEVTTTLAKPLEELRTTAKLHAGTAVECLQVILNPAAKKRESLPAHPSAPSVPNTRRLSEGGKQQDGGNAAANPLSGLQEAQRICRAREGGYHWCYTVLNLKYNATQEEVQRQFRYYMKLLHPDKFLNSMPTLVSQALEKVKRAKKDIETELNRRNVKLPGPVRSLAWQLVNGMRGYRTILLKWDHPGGHVDKYTIQVLDPSYGRFLNICVLEPDYYEDRQKFVSIEELNEYTIDEKKLEKMAHLFECTECVEFQVAAHNSGGIGPYISLKVDMSGKTYASRPTPPPPGPHTATPARSSYFQSPAGDSEEVNCATMRVELSATYKLHGEAGVRELLSHKRVKEKREFLKYCCVKCTGNSEDLTRGIINWLNYNRFS